VLCQFDWGSLATSCMARVALKGVSHEYWVLGLLWSFGLLLYVRGSYYTSGVWTRGFRSLGVCACSGVS